MLVHKDVSGPKSLNHAARRKRDSWRVAAWLASLRMTFTPGDERFVENIAALADATVVMFMCASCGTIRRECLPRDFVAMHGEPRRCKECRRRDAIKSGLRARKVRGERVGAPRLLLGVSDQELRVIVSGAPSLHAAHRLLQAGGAHVSWTTFHRRVKVLRVKEPGAAHPGADAAASRSGVLAAAAVVARKRGVSVRTALRSYDYIVSPLVAAIDARR